MSVVRIDRRDVLRCGGVLSGLCGRGGGVLSGLRGWGGGRGGMERR